MSRAPAPLPWWLPLISSQFVGVSSAHRVIFLMWSDKHSIEKTIPSLAFGALLCSHPKAMLSLVAAQVHGWPLHHSVPARAISRAAPWPRWPHWHPTGFWLPGEDVPVGDFLSRSPWMAAVLSRKYAVQTKWFWKVNNSVQHKLPDLK